MKRRDRRNVYREKITGKDSRQKVKMAGRRPQAIAAGNRQES